jgi:hypothetical protein
MTPHLLEQVSASLGREHLDQMLLRCGQNASESDDNQIIDQMCANVLGTPAHVFLLEATHALRNGTFDLTLRSHWK